MRGFVAALGGPFCVEGHDMSRYRVVRYGAWTVAAIATLVLLLTAPPALAHRAHIFERSFGSPGTAAGQLSMSAFGFGKGEYGSDVAVALETGDVYVADTNDHRVEEFSSSGAFILVFAHEVDETTKGDICTAASGDPCGPGVAGAEPGELESPSFVAVDNACALHKPALTGTACEAFDPSNGDVYVADSGDDTVSKFKTDGELEASWADEGQLRETPTLAMGTGDIAEGSATGTGDLTQSSTTISNVATSTGAFVVGLGIESNNIPSGTYITEVGTGTLTISQPHSRPT
jgi:hypothetical protein